MKIMKIKNWMQKDVSHGKLAFNSEITFFPTISMSKQKYHRLISVWMKTSKRPDETHTFLYFIYFEFLRWTIM